MFSLPLRVLSFLLKPPAIPNRVRLALACIIGASVPVLAGTASAQAMARAAPNPAPVAAPGDLAQTWMEAVNLERTSWDLEVTDLDRSYDLATEAARRFEAVAEWLTVATTPDVVSQLSKLGFSVAVEKYAGVTASISNEALYCPLL